MNCSGNRVRGFDFAYQRTEIGKTYHSVALEITFPPDRLDDLADDLSQPPQRVGTVKRDRVGSRFQKVAALTHQKLQVNFKRLSVEDDNRGSIPNGAGILIQFQSRNERLGRILERPGMKVDFDICSIVLVRLRASGLRFQPDNPADRWLLIHGDESSNLYSAGGDRLSSMCATLKSVPKPPPYVHSEYSQCSGLKLAQKEGREPLPLPRADARHREGQ